MRGLGLAVAVSAVLLVSPATAQERRRGPEEDGAWHGVTHKTPSKLEHFLPTGFSFPARLDNMIFSYNVETPAVAVVERDITYLGRVVVPTGTRVIGTVSVQQSHDRVLIDWHTIVFPEGDEVQFSGIALSPDGSAGLEGRVEQHKDSAVANTVLRSVISGTQAALDMSGVSPVAAEATQGLSQEAIKDLDVQKQQVTTSITVQADAGLRVYVNRRLEY